VTAKKQTTFALFRDFFKKFWADLLRYLISYAFFRADRSPIFFQQRVHFHNTGPSLVPGIIVMSIEDARNDVHEMAQLDKK
jgi:hypothetical protein